MIAKAKLQEQTGELRLWQHGAIFIFACAILIARRPDAIYNAQFFQEDGHVWFADAYNFGWWAGLFRIYEGYHHVSLRLVASLALLAPLRFAPLVLNVVAIATQALPANLILSARSSAWGSVRFRALLAGIYLVLPNTNEMLNDISQSQWPLTLCAFLLIVGCVPTGVAGRLLDMSIVLLIGLTGPECVFLLPVALFLAWRREESWRWVAPGILAATCFIQAWPLLHGGLSSRPHFALGASPTMLTRILAGDVYLGALLGSNGLAAAPSAGVFISLSLVTVVGTFLIVCCYVRSPVEMKLFVLLTSALLAASLISPSAYPPAGVSVWQFLAGSGGIRYWYFPTLVFAWSILWCYRSRAIPVRAISGLLLCLMCFGIIRDFRYPALKDLHFAQDVKRFEAVAPGTAFVFPQNPQGWNLTLVKRPSGR